MTYRRGVENLDLEKMEQTFGAVYGGVDPHYDFSIGPLRQAVSHDEKKRYHLEAAEIKNGVMRQLYVWRGNQDSGVLNEVIELVWEA